MIRQAISCDICGAEKKQTNHWFVACAHGGELRITGWNASGGRMRAGSKHLCGQTCLHKLLDEFIAGTMSSRTPAAAEAADRIETAAATDASLTSKAAYVAVGTGNTPAASTVSAARPLQVVPAAVIAIGPSRIPDDALSTAAPPQFEEPSSYGSRRWRAEAWERERERERRAGLTAHRKTS